MLLSLALALIYTLAQLLLVDVNKVRIYTAKIKKWRDKYKKAMKSGNPRLISEVQKESEIINKLQLELSKETFKPMFASFLLFFIVFTIITSAYGNSVAVVLPFWSPFPWFGPQSYIRYNNQSLSGLSAFWWYVLTSISFSAIINVILKITGRRPY